MRVLSLLLVLCAAALPARAETVASVASPGGVLRVELDISDGRAGYRVFHRDRPVIATSRLGFHFQDAEQFLRNLTLQTQRTADFDETWEQPWGERRLVRNHYRELRARLVEGGRARRAFDVVFRVYDDGLGFRYEFPAQPSLREVRIAEELTEFDLAEPATAWWIPAGEWNRYEYLYHRTRLDEVGTAHTPLTLRTDSGLHLSLHEAALVDYASMWLRRVDGRRLRAQLAPSAQGWKVRRTAPFATPWRTLQVSPTAGGLVESSLILNLNEPNALGDVSWFTPHKYVGVWWSLHLDTESWGTGPRHGATTANVKRYIDFAAEHGFRGVLVEGWNTGWDGDWFANGWNFDFARPTPDYDLEALAAYARARGVHLIGHHETACAVSHYERQMGRAFALFARLGIDSIKTGYVCDAGQIERQDTPGGPVLREWHDGQWMARHHLRVVREAARHRIAVNAHEPIKDTGLRRTYPNWIAREGARGMEYNAWGNPPNPPEHEVNLVFTRLLAGPMDYTPGVVSLKGRHGQPFQTTLARQLAHYVTIYSPIQMVADLPEHYAARPDAFQFIKDVAVDWEQTRVLAGEVGDYVAIARQARGSDDWFLGAITDEHARTLTLPLRFLAPGRRYQAQIYRDGEGAHYRDNPFAFVRETREVGADDTLTLALAAGGGAAIRFTPVPAPPQVAAGRIERFVLPSRHLPPRTVDVWLPDGYPRHGPYAVLYMHDGQMLFDAATTWNRQEWRADETAAALIASGATRPFIIVGIHNGGVDRARDYFPQRPFASLPQAEQDALYAIRFGQDRLFSGPVRSDAYLKFLVEELKPHIEARYAVGRAREDTVVMGSSLGALVSLYALAEYPDVFGGAAALSTHWPGRVGDSPDNPVPAAFLRYFEQHLPAAGRHRLYFDHGTETLDASYADRQREVDRLLRAKGYTARDWLTRTFPGAEHSENAWAARLAVPLRFLLGR